MTRTNLRQRIRRLEEIVHRRLAAEAARLSLPPEEPQSLEELHKLDAATLTDMCMDLIRGRKAPDTEEFRQAHARYRRMPFRQLLCVYPHLKRRHRHQMAERNRRLAARRAAAHAELARPEPVLTPGSLYDAHYQHAIAYRRLLSTLCWQ